MTIPNNEPAVSGPHPGNGAAVVFPYGFRIYEADELNVRRLNVDGSEEELTLETEYSVQGAGDEGGGTITLVDAALASTGTQILIEQNVTSSQEKRYSAQSSTDLSELEETFDKLTSLIIRLQASIGRSLSVSPFFVGALEIPNLIGDRALVADADALGMSWGPTVSEIANAAQNAVAAAQDALAADTSRADAETAQVSALAAYAQAVLKSAEADATATQLRAEGIVRNYAGAVSGHVSVDHIATAAEFTFPTGTWLVERGAAWFARPTGINYGIGSLRANCAQGGGWGVEIGAAHAAANDQAIYDQGGNQLISLWAGRVVTVHGIWNGGDKIALELSGADVAGFTASLDLLLLPVT